MRLSRVFLRGFMIGIAMFAVAIPAVYLLMGAGRGFFFAPMEMAIPIGLLILSWLLISFICASVHDKGVAPNMMRSGIVMAAIASIGWISVLIVEVLGSSYVSRILPWHVVLIWPSVWAGLCMLIGLLLLITPRAVWWGRLRNATIVFVTLLGVWCVVVVMLEQNYYTRTNIVTAWYAGHAGLVAYDVFLSLPFAAALLLGAVAVFFGVRPANAHCAQAVRVLIACMAGAAVLVAIGSLVFPPVTSPDELRNILRTDNAHLLRSGDDRYEMIMYSLGMILFLLTGLFYLGVVGSALLLRVSGRPLLNQERLSYELTCPRCALNENALTGEHLCSNCGLRIRLDLT